MIALLRNKYFWMALIWIVSIAATGYTTWDYCTAKADQEKLQAVEGAVAEQKALDRETTKIEVAAAEARQKTRIVYRDRIKRVTEYVQATNRVQCFDPDGVRLFNLISQGMEDSGSNPMRENATGP